MNMPDTNTTIHTAAASGSTDPAKDAAQNGTQLLWPRQVILPAASGHPGHLPIARITWFRQHAGTSGAQQQAMSGWMLAGDQTGTTMDLLLADQEQIDAFLPTAEQLMDDPAASLWLKSALAAAMARDPVKAANEAQVLAQVLGRRADTILRKTCQDQGGVAPAQRGREVHTFPLP